MQPSVDPKPRHGRSKSLDKFDDVVDLHAQLRGDVWQGLQPGDPRATQRLTVNRCRGEWPDVFIGHVA